LQELQFLEGIRSFFVNSRPLDNGGEDVSVQVIAFRSESEYARYAFRAVGGAYYVRTFCGDYIALRDISPRNRELVAHEYTHLVVEHAGLKLPIWLNEGVAELYSSVESAGEQVTVGRAPSGHIATIAHQHWIPWDVLFAVDRDSPYYNEGEKVSMFYAQSWALVHMLALSEGYSGHFKQFLAAVSAGQNSSEALQSIYHKNMAAIEADLVTYLHRVTLPVLVFNNKPEVSRIQPVMARPGDFELHFALANLLSAKPATLGEAQTELSVLSTRYPERPEPEEALGTLAVQQNRKEEARRHLALAIQRHSRNSEIFYQYAALQQSAGAKSVEVAALLRQALEITPDLDKARLELGFIEEQDSHFESALSLLSGLKVVPGGEEYEVYSSLAQCDLRLERSAEAKSYAEKAKQAARNQEQRQEAEDLLASLVSDESADVSNATPITPAPSLTHVQGRTKALECSNGQRRLRIEVDGREMVFDLDDPSLMARNAGESYPHWSCGRLQGDDVTVVYMPWSEGSQGTDGRAREIVFVSVVGVNSGPKRR